MPERPKPRRSFEVGGYDSEKAREYFESIGAHVVESGK
jgi:hypothetical protein